MVLVNKKNIKHETSAGTDVIDAEKRKMGAT